VPGNVIESIFIPARGFMKGRLVAKGHVTRIVNTKGKQCADCIIWDAADLENVLNCCMTMMLNKRWNKWKPGDILFSKQCEKLAMITDDKTDGTHAALGAFCNEAYTRVTTGIPGCPNCRDNLLASMADYGFSAEELDWGSCITFFMSVLYQQDGTIARSEPTAKPGDYIDFIAERDIIVAISNCPSERSAVAYSPSPLQVVIYDPGKEYKAKVRSLQTI
jgi:uncharacterized protein YcgI (DUF1989 family)